MKQTMQADELTDVIPSCTLWPRLFQDHNLVYFQAYQEAKFDQSRKNRIKLIK